MRVELKKIKIRDLVKGYKNNLEDGVVGYAGRLDIRPPYQREFVYSQSQQDAVVDSVINRYPLNIMYWAVRDSQLKAEGNDELTLAPKVDFEIIDGQQRTLSICRYINGDFAYDNKYFYNLWDEEQEKILEYELDVYLCKGTSQEKLEWFERINIAGEKLTDQELRNAVYYGPFIADAKRYFSKTSCPAYQVGCDYLKGNPIRQDYLETIIKWKSKGDIEDYMAQNQFTESAEELWKYFEEIIDWVKKVFPKYRKEMLGLNWGPLYDEFKDIVDSEGFDSAELEKRIVALMKDEDVTKKKGIYEYILNGDERALSIRCFDNRQKREVYESQAGICPICEEHFDLSQMQADHITPWSKGGKTTSVNCQMLCAKCNNKKSNK